MNDWRIIERSLGADVVARFKESWTLEEFLKEHGPKMQIGYYPVANDGSISFKRCRYGDVNKDWVYSYVSLRITEFTPDWIVKNKEYLRVGKTELGDYVLYLNQQHGSWTNVEFPEASDEKPENIFSKLKVYGKKF